MMYISEPLVISFSPLYSLSGKAVPSRPLRLRPLNPWNCFQNSVLVLSVDMNPNLVMKFQSLVSALLSFRPLGQSMLSGVTVWPAQL